MKHPVEHRENKFFCARGRLVLWSRLHRNKHPRARTAIGTGPRSLDWGGFRVGALGKQGGKRVPEGRTEQPGLCIPQPGSGRGSSLLPSAASASNGKPKQHWQQQATIFNYTAGITCSLKNSLIALCLTTWSPSPSNQVLRISPRQPWGPWNMSTSFLESFILFFFQHEESLDMRKCWTSHQRHPKKSSASNTHTFHAKVSVILILIHISMARRGREARQAPAQPAPCASAAEHLALPEPRLCLPRRTPRLAGSVRKGLNEGPLTPLPGVSRHREKQKPAPLFLSTRRKRKGARYVW